MEGPSTYAAIHPSATVFPGVELGKDVEIGPYSVIEAGAVIGDGCRIGPMVHILGRTEIGPRCKISAGTVLGGEPQDDKFQGERSLLRIGSDCHFHEHVTVNRATGEDGVTTIGSHVRMMAGAHVGHNCTVDNHVVLVNGIALGGFASIGERSILSGNAMIHQFTKVGRLCMVAGGSMVTSDVPPFSIVTGAHPVRWRGVNRVGLSRAGIDPDESAAIRRAMRRIFGSDANARLEAEALTDSQFATVRELSEFILGSKRGVCAGLLKR
ncbi:MAG: acyl-ACP--UDP-N-acetylglucosamine O-acyltransferase [Planctomycetota bacterium]|jgi:UDP-N-acetylglucosamine acyltransferase|nr:acyl-ACP--UDP-N-acetylglucosamine O-acyltransferase [Planctomycetota bacterium]